MKTKPRDIIFRSGKRSQYVYILWQTGSVKCSLASKSPVNFWKSSRLSSQVLIRNGFLSSERFYKVMRYELTERQGVTNKITGC